MEPNRKNFCGGNFQDWLEVNLTDKCNGKCSWCIEKNGFHPKEHAPWWAIASKALATRKSNIILLGGEPTLYPNLKEMIQVISSAGREVFITTNGERLSPDFIMSNLVGVTGVNISIHSFDLDQNKDIVGVELKPLPYSISALHEIGAVVRLNCNCIAGYIDSEAKVEQYVSWAKMIGADKIRFAELKQDDDSFVDLAKILNYKYGLNDDPFTYGCNSDAVINNMPVNFRQMCGLQTPRRIKPINPVQYKKQVLYYDGKIYDGWQTLTKEYEMSAKELFKIFCEIEKGEVTSEEAFARIMNKEITGTSPKEDSQGSSLYGGCCY